MTKIRVRQLFLCAQLSILIVFGLAVCFCVSGCVAGNYHQREITRFYSPTGIYTGKSEKSSSSVRFYSPTGIYTGQSVKSGSTVRYYDQKGRFVMKGVSR